MLQKQTNISIEYIFDISTEGNRSHAKKHLIFMWVLVSLAPVSDTQLHFTAILPWKYYPALPVFQVYQKTCLKIKTMQINKYFKLFHSCAALSYGPSPALSNVVILKKRL